MKGQVETLRLESISRKQLEMLFIATIANNRQSVVRQYGRLS